MTKIFAEKGRVQLVGDERDVAVVSTHREDVWKWCEDKKIELEYQGSLGKTDLWRVQNDQQRAWFILKWT